MQKNYYFTSESVTEGHPDKLCDFISDFLLDEYLKQDPNSRVAIETFATKNKVVVSGEVTSKAEVNIELVVRNAIKEIGYGNEQLDINPDNPLTIISIVFLISKLDECRLISVISLVFNNRRDTLIKPLNQFF